MPAQTRAEINKRYREAHPKRVLLQVQKWRHANPEWVRKHNQEGWLRRRLKPEYPRAKRIASKSFNSRLKEEVMSHYGPLGKIQCAWPECGVIDIDMLTLDHMDGGGNEDRRVTGKGGGCATYSYLRKNGFPVGFQVLCMNHQLKKDILKRRSGM